MIYILDKFPNLTETFILREIITLKKLGINIQIYVLKKPAEEIVHPDILPLLTDVIYVQQIALKQKISAVLSTFFYRPALFVKFIYSLFLDMFFSFRFMYHRWRGAVYAMTIAKFADSGVDHIHAHFAYVTTDVAGMLAELKGCKWSVSAHAWDIFTQPKKLLRRRIKGADKIFVCSKHGQKLLVDNGIATPGIPVLMYHGVNSAEFEVKDQSDYIISIGRLEEKKGFGVLLQAFRILAEQDLKPKCLIVGEGPEREKLESEIKDFNLTNIEFTGALPFDKVKELLAASSMMVQPSVVTGNGDHDGIPNVLLEAMALTKPVITTDVGGITEVIEDGTNGILVKTGDAGELAEAIKELLKDKERAKKIGAAGEKFVKENFEISETIKPLYEYFRV